MTYEEKIQETINCVVTGLGCGLIARTIGRPLGLAMWEMGLLAIGMYLVVYFRPRIRN